MINRRSFGIAAEVRPAEAVILFWVGRHRLAIAADAVRVILTDRGQEPQELGIASVVSSSALLGMPPGGEALWLVLRCGNIAVRVDRVDRLVEIAEVRPLPMMFRGMERSWYRGLALIDGEVTPVIDPMAFLRQARPAPAATEGAPHWPAAHVSLEGVPA